MNLAAQHLIHAETSLHILTGWKIHFYIWHMGCNITQTIFTFINDKWCNIKELRLFKKINHNTINTSNYATVI